MRRKPHRQDRKPLPSPPESLFEAEVLPGLEPFARRELEALGGVNLGLAEGAVPFHFGGDLKRLQGLRTVVAVYEVMPFPVPRPKALLGHEHLTRLVRGVARVRDYDAAQRFKSFRFSAAGRESGVFARLAEAVSRETGLTHDPEEGDLLLRVRRAPEGWDVLVRLTPRPLSARPWRVCNLEGGLNATLAVAMLEMAAAKPHERFLNAMCGSGTLVVEQLARRTPARIVACDLSEAALTCARENVAASGLDGVEFVRADATQLAFADMSFEVIAADPPWGDAVGSHEGNAALYPAFLREMARVAAPGARFVLLTHELRLLERTLRAQAAWRSGEPLRVFHGGHYPRVYLLTRSDSA